MSSNSEANASELLENLEVMFSRLGHKQMAIELNDLTLS